MCTPHSTLEIVQNRFTSWHSQEKKLKERLFLDYVEHKISKLHPKATVIKTDDHIRFISAINLTEISLFPIWREGIKDVKKELAEDIDRAIGLLRSNMHKNIYLLYPKSETLAKHIDIKSKELEDGTSTLKIIPYKLCESFRSKLSF